MMMESRVTTPFGKDYGFIFTCNKGSTKFPELSTTSEHYRVAELLPVQQRS